MLNIDYDIYKKNLLLTQQYCDIQERNIVANEAMTDVASVFRSFMPELDGVEVMEFGVAEFQTGGTIEKELVKSVRWTIDPGSKDEYFYGFFRDQMAYKEESLQGLTPEAKYEGHVVVVYVDYSLKDGVAEKESYYLFDHYDLPPIDTWFYITEIAETRMLFAWVPHAYCGWADSLIEADRIESLAWFDKKYPTYYKWLHE